MRDELKSVILEYGEQCVMMCLEQLMLGSFADNLAT